MTRERLDQIFDEKNAKWERDNALQGLNILAKYTDNVLHAAEHDIIYGPPVDDIIDDLTEEDAAALATLNWMIDNEGFACFV